MTQSYRSTETISGRLALALDKVGENYSLSLESPVNEVGLLFRVGAVLYTRGWDIVSGSITSPGRTAAVDTFVLHRAKAPHPAELRELSIELESLLFKGVSVLEYLTAKNAPPPAGRDPGAQISTGSERGMPYLEIVTKDRRGLFLSVTQAFFLMDVNIMEATIQTDSFGRARDRFLVDSLDARFSNEEFLRRLREELQQIL